MTHNGVKYRITELGGDLEDISDWEKIVKGSHVVVYVIDEYLKGTKRMKHTRELLELTSPIVRNHRIPTVVIGNRMEDVNDEHIRRVVQPYLTDVPTTYCSISTITDGRLETCMSWIEQTVT